jgi:hypothetical protein
MPLCSSIGGVGGRPKLELLRVTPSACREVAFLGPKLNRGALQGRQAVEEFKIKEGAAVAKEAGSLDLSDLVGQLEESLSTLKKVCPEI